MDGISLEQYSRLVELIYDAGADRSRWQAFVDALSTTFDEARVVMQAHDLASNLSLGTLNQAYDPALAASYDEHYASINAWLPAIMAMPLGRAATPETWVPRQDLVNSEYYADWARPQGLDTAAGLVLHRDANRVMILSANLNEAREGHKQQPMLGLLDLLAPHLYRAFDLARRAAGSAAGAPLQAVLATLPDAALVLSRDGRVLIANAAAEALLRTRSLRLAEGRLSFGDAEADRRLHLALHRIATADYRRLGGPFPVRGSAGQPPLMATVTPLTEAVRSLEAMLPILGDSTPTILLRLQASVPAAATAAQLQAAYGLTRAEAALALDLANGHALQTIAQSRNTSPHTVRNQLKSVFEKTGVHRQAELVALLRRA